jgi:hypothetical protein
MKKYLLITSPLFRNPKDFLESEPVYKLAAKKHALPCFCADYDGILLPFSDDTDTVESIIEDYEHDIRGNFQDGTGVLFARSDKTGYQNIELHFVLDDASVQDIGVRGRR